MCVCVGREGWGLIIGGLGRFCGRSIVFVAGGGGEGVLEVCFFPTGTPLTLVGYEMIIAIYHLIFNSRLWKNNNLLSNAQDFISPEASISDHQLLPEADPHLPFKLNSTRRCSSQLKQGLMSKRDGSVASGLKLNTFIVDWSSEKTSSLRGIWCWKFRKRDDSTCQCGCEKYHS